MPADEGSRTTLPGRLDTLAILRVVVAYLGEKDQFGWWPTAFLSTTGRRFLELNFPRTLVSAGVTSVTQLAKGLHDQRIGQAGAFHLFRLPHGLEQYLHGLLAADAGQRFVELISGRDPALQLLDAVAEGESGCGAGALRVSGFSQLTHRPTLRKVAASYRDAFLGGYQAYPYFVGS
jgi:hypothetical protein